MDAFEYFVVLSTIILGLGITQILTGVSDLVADWDKVKFSMTHSIYTLVVFIIHLQDWWFSYMLSVQIEGWTFVKVLGLLTFHIVLFLQARILFPTGSRAGETDMVKYFGENWRLLYSLGAVTVVISIWQNHIFSDIPVWTQYPQLAYLAAYIGIILSKTKNFYVHVTFAVLQLLIWMAIIVSDEQIIF